MIIIMLGAPATGKGSVAALLSEKYNIPAISSGDIFRKIATPSSIYLFTIFCKHKTFLLK